MKKSGKPKYQKSEPSRISKIAVAGYKSISTECTIEIKPLTILAGANSSGKSSIIQPLLLIKQTLDANYDPGALKLTGPNVCFSSGEQLLCKCHDPNETKSIELKFWVNDAMASIHYGWKRRKGFEIIDQVFKDAKESFALRPDMGMDELKQNLPKDFTEMIERFGKAAGEPKLKVIRDRSFLEVQVRSNRSKGGVGIGMAPAGLVVDAIKGLIHLPGLRGNPERNYPVTAVGKNFPGTFQEYTASVIVKWQTGGEKEKLKSVGKDLERLGLTWKVAAIRRNDTQVELLVGRMPHPTHAGAYDLVSIADVGFGVSQTLPVIVALHAAVRGQIVFLEQPEIHLHPRAQMALAEVLADAANRGVIVIVETHSSILLRGIQTVVAQQKLGTEKVSLNWFKRNQKSGQTECVSGVLDNGGAFGDWPEDFDEVTLESEKRFLDANEVSLN